MGGVAVSEEPVFPADAVEVGRILGAWGVKGWIKVQAYSADPQALFSSKRWFLLPPEGPGGAVRPGSGVPAVLRVTQAREHGDGVVAGIHDLSDRAGAEALRGASVWVSRSSFPTAQANEFYWVDLIGLAVVNREGQALGTVTGLLETGAHCVLQVRQQGPEAQAATAPEGGVTAAAGSSGATAERLIPFVDAYVDRVDLEGRQVLVDWGLDY